MSFKDDVAYPAAPGRFFKGATGIEVTYYVTLKADRAALDARVVLRNPHAKAINYEYWTCTTLAPDPTRTIPGRPAAPKSSRRSRPYTTPRYWAHLADGDERVGAGSRFEKFATSKTGRRWASPTRPPTCRAATFGA